MHHKGFEKKQQAHFAQETVKCLRKSMHILLCTSCSSLMCLSS